MPYTFFVAIPSQKFVSASQPLNALAFIVDGLHYGVSDFPYAAYSMVHFYNVTVINNYILNTLMLN